MSRPGGAALELAILLPVLMLMFAAVFDYGRVFYYSQTVENCARAGAIYASDDVAAASSPYASIQEAARAEAPNLSPQPTVSSSTGTDGDGNDYVRVTVSWTFRTITGFPGIPATKNLSRTVQMRKIE